MLTRILAKGLGRVLGAATLSAMLAGAAGAVTAPIVVVEVDSGKVIYAQGATDPWYPASITKLMTTYVALDLVRQGKASMDTLLTISAQAAAEPPSKMGFRPGTQITLDNALKIIMVKSANDVAFAIGENLGGSVEGFSDLMNETARRIGMQESRWYNPNGLPEPRQWTTARDMAILGRALIRDFPESRELFSISAIQYGKAVMANHNGLLGRYAGADGMKTGFICSGGFNVVASATRGGKRIIAVVMGQKTPRERDLKAADLFDYGFSQSAGWTAPTLEALPVSHLQAPPDMRPYVCGGKAIPVEEGQAAIPPSSLPGADNATAQLLGATMNGAAPLALASLNAAGMRGRSLPPRAALQPIAVWTGRTPAEGAAAAEQAEAEAKAAHAAKAAAWKQKKLAAREAAKQARDEKAARVRAAAVTAAPKQKPAVPAATSAYTAVEGAGKKPAKAVPKEAAPKAKEAAPKAKPGGPRTEKPAKPAKAADKPAAGKKSADAAE